MIWCSHSPDCRRSWSYMSTQENSPALPKLSSPFTYTPFTYTQYSRHSLAQYNSRANAQADS